MLTNPGKPRAKKPHVNKRSIRNAKPVTFLMEKYRDVTFSPPKRRQPRTSGLTTKMGLFEYMAAVFEANESLPAFKRLTNEAIKVIMTEEFSHSVKFVRQVNRHKGNVVNYYRHLYNCGRLTSTPPAAISFRYNESGQRVDSRTGTKLLNHKEQEAWVQKYRELFPVMQRKRLENAAKRREKLRQNRL